MQLKISSTKWQPFGPEGDELIYPLSTLRLQQDGRHVAEEIINAVENLYLWFQ